MCRMKLQSRALFQVSFRSRVIIHRQASPSLDYPRWSSLSWEEDMRMASLVDNCHGNLVTCVTLQAKNSNSSSVNSLSLSLSPLTPFILWPLPCTRYSMGVSCFSHRARTHNWTNWHPVKVFKEPNSLLNKLKFKFRAVKCKRVVNAGKWCKITMHTDI